MNDLLMAADAGSSLLILLDLSTAFDNVDHTVLLESLHTTIGRSDSTLKQLQSYLSSRTEYVPLGGCRSDCYLPSVVFGKDRFLTASQCFPLTI